ncbi:MAG: hypothetical protein HYW90_05060 [Candidatus Sungbacteria bacterium]|nr:hypothetical protein [Candidatus Sungbacteria bacterium]
MFFFNQAGKKYGFHEGWRSSGSWVVLCLTFVVFLFLGYHTIGVVRKERALRREMRGLEEKVAALKIENEKLDKSLGGEGRDQMIEKLGKAELNLQIPGEEVAIIVLSTTSPQINNQARQSWWNKVRSLFKGKGG